VAKIPRGILCSKANFSRIEERSDQKATQRFTSVSETPPDADEDFRSLWIVGPESQKTPIIPDRVRDTGKVDGEDFALFDLFYFIIQPLVEIELNRLNFERFFEFGFDVYGFCDPFSARSLQKDIPGRQVNGCLDKSFNFYAFNRMPGIIRVDFGGLSQSSIVASGIDLDCDLALPTGGDCPIVIGNSAASTGADLSYLKGLITRVQDSKTVGHNRAFIHFFKVKVLLFYDHPRSGGMRGLGSSEKCTEKREGQSEKM
jgi:hypothetical protein